MGRVRCADFVRLVGLIGVASFLSSCAGAGWLSRNDETAAKSPGRALYLVYCDACHGDSGRGDGDAVESLRVPPPDLRRLWRKYGTPLDPAPLAEYIDGRWLLGVHGTREMPIFGEDLVVGDDASSPGLEDARRHLFRLLVDYLETIQKH